MITRPMQGQPPVKAKGHSEEPLQPQPWQSTNGPHGGYPMPIRRTKSYAFNPRILPPVNKVVGPPRLYGG